MQLYLQNLFGFEVLPVTVPFPSTWQENASTIAITAVFKSILPIWMRLVECRSFLTRGQLYIPGPCGNSFISKCCICTNVGEKHRSTIIFMEKRNPAVQIWVMVWFSLVGEKVHQCSVYFLYVLDFG